MRIEIEMGEEQRTVVSGVAHNYEPEALIGKKVTYLVNLKPRMLKGIESQGMLLLGENKDGGLIFISPEDNGVPSGIPIS